MSGSRWFDKSPVLRDGVRLISRIWLPNSNGPWPALLMRQPYGREIASTITYSHPEWWASKGYMVIIQDVRGMGSSEGVFNGFSQEASDTSETHKWVLEGLFGPSYKIIKTDELMKKGHVATLDINVLLLKHSPNKFETFEDEIQYIIGHNRRNNFIKNLALDLSGNTLILYSRVEAHGQPLFELINKSKSDNRQVFFVHGGVETEDRENVRAITERENNAIIVASYGTFSTGINIKNLHNVIFASPSKSRIRNLQSIGRVLRKGDRKLKATLYDIADDISYNKRKNYTLNHLIERIKIYNQENFNYDIVNIPLKN